MRYAMLMLMAVTLLTGCAGQMAGGYMRARELYLGVRKDLEAACAKAPATASFGQLTTAKCAEFRAIDLEVRVFAAKLEAALRTRAPSTGVDFEQFLAMVMSWRGWRPGWRSECRSRRRAPMAWAGTCSTLPL